MNINNVTFSDCDFYNCNIKDVDEDRVIYTLGCTANDEDFLSNLCSKNEDSTFLDNERLSAVDIYLLERFWPVGRSTFIKHRPIKAICTKNNKFSYSQIMKSLSVLRRRNILISPDKVNFLELNIERLPEVKLALGRD